MQKKKIMIVDDDREFLEELTEILTLNGYDTMAFSDSTLAMKKFYDIKPDLILLDLKMNKKSGFQIADELKHSPETAHVPIIAITGYYTEKEHASLMNIYGIKSCLIKPFDPQELIRKIEED